jgi:hypothetical protein
MFRLFRLSDKSVGVREQQRQTMEPMRNRHYTHSFMLLAMAAAEMP